MRIVAVETIRLDEHPFVLLVRIHTDEGLIGLGDTSRFPEATSAFIHSVAAPMLLGQDPLAIERRWQELYAAFPVAGLQGGEIRAISAIDVALWDIAGQAYGVPIHRLMGGPTRDRVRIYNTCAGYRYGAARRETTGWDATYTDGRSEGPYEDLDAWKDDAGALAKDLLAQGITAMKIWPFDQFVAETSGQRITAAQIDKGLRPWRQIRDAVGDQMEVALEMHSNWNLPSAIRIAKAVEPYDPMWFEDPVLMNNLDALVTFKAATNVPITASETLSTRFAFRDLLHRGAVSIVMFDIGWTGGLTEARKIATMADAYQLPIAPHDCAGPVSYVAAVHLDFASSNVFIQETVRAFNAGWYARLLTALPPIEDGLIRPLDGPGLGTALRPEVLARSDVHVECTDA